MCNHGPNREAAMVTLRRDNTGKPTVWCDPCIAPIVDALNTGDLDTVASCCGHGYWPAWVMTTLDEFWMRLTREQWEALHPAMRELGMIRDQDEPTDPEETP